MRFAYLTLLVACSHHEPAAPDAASPDASAASNCGGDPMYGHVVLHGAFELVAFDGGPVTSDSKIIGVLGSADGPDLFSLNSGDILHADLGTLGDHDVAPLKLKYLKWPYGTSSACTPGPCHGFFAGSGTYTVTQTSPRYQATFTLGDLSAHDDETNTMGAPIAGSVTGCIDVKPQP